MSAQILDGNAIARGIRRSIAGKVRERIAAGERHTGLAVVLVGDPGSVIYVRLKSKHCRQVGFKVDVRHLPADTAEGNVVALEEELNVDPGFDGILVQLRQGDPALTCFALSSRA